MIAIIIMITIIAERPSVTPKYHILGDSGTTVRYGHVGLFVATMLGEPASK